jgi:threonine aldolase
MDFLESLSPNKALNDDEEHESNLAQTLEAKCQKVDVKEVAQNQNQNHLTIKEPKQLAALLSDCSKLFSRELGLCPHQKPRLKLIENAKPAHKEAHPVPHSKSKCNT